VINIEHDRIDCDAEGRSLRPEEGKNDEKSEPGPKSSVENRSIKKEIISDIADKLPSRFVRL